jgi:hypothetical protein
VPLQVFQEWNANSGYGNTLTGEAWMVYEAVEVIGLTNPKHINWLAQRPGFVMELLLPGLREIFYVLSDEEDRALRLRIEQVIDFVLMSKIKITDAEVAMLMFDDPRIFSTIQKIYTEGNGDSETKAFIRRILQGLTTDPQAIRDLVDLDEKIGLSKAQFQWLFDNKIFINQHLDYLNNNNSHSLEVKKEAIKVNLHFLTTDPEYAALTTSMAGWPGWAWEVFAEVMVEVGARIVKKQLGLTIGDDAKDAIKTCAGGEVLECIGNVIEVLRRFFPALKLIDLGLDSIEFGGKAKDVWKGIDKVINLGQANFERAWAILKKMSVSFLDIEDVGKYLKYVDDLKTPKLGNKFATKSTYRDNFRGMFPEVKGQIEEVHHAFPQVLFDNQDRYGYLGITTDQMHSFENLRGVSKTLHDQLDAHWTTWLRNNTPPVSQHFPKFNEIKDFAKYLDDLYGSSLVPPIR